MFKLDYDYYIGDPVNKLWQERPIMESFNVNIENYQQKNVKLPIAAFIKKPEFDGPTLKINNFKKEDLKNSLISNDSKVLLSGELFKSNLNSEIISNMLYGNLYGVKTQR